MGILNRDEITRRIACGELIINARMKSNGEYDIQPASYDLTAGRAVWKENATKGVRVREMIFQARQHPSFPQPYVVLQPGQMMSVITHEEINMPLDHCGTVYSKNGLALNGIFAFNAGHVDPGFRGPIVIRLINLRATPWTFTLGERIFTIVFHTVDYKAGDELRARGAIDAQETLQRVRHFTDIALSNALFDLYAENIEKRLNQYYAATLDSVTEALGKEFIRKDKFGSELGAWAKRNAWSLLSISGVIFALIRNWEAVRKFLGFG